MKITEAHPNFNRRSLMAGFPALIAALHTGNVSAAADIAMATDPLPGIYERWVANHEKANSPALGDDDPMQMELEKERTQLERSMADLKPVSTAGAAALVKFVRDEIEGDLSWAGHKTALANAIEFLEEVT